MIIKINNKLIGILKEDKSYGWNNVETPYIENINSELDLFKELDFSTPDTFFETYIVVVDKQNYIIMSNTELTDFLYRLSSWGVENIINLISF